MNIPARNMMDLQQAFDCGFEAVKKYIDAELSDLRKEIAELKAVSMKYRGVWSAEKVYHTGDAVTDHGSIYHANEPSVGVRPGNGGPWQQAVKRGADGKDARR